MTYKFFTLLSVLVLMVLPTGCNKKPRICGEGTIEEGTECVLKPLPCPAGQILVNETCVPVAKTCAPGTVLKNNTCVPEALVCGTGTHAEKGVCVLDGPNAPQILETDDTEPPPLIPMPNVGESITFGGGFSEPVDMSGDGYVEGDWDTFVLVANAGTYLKARATSQGSASPAFVIESLSTDASGYPIYQRFVFDPETIGDERELYLPLTDTYVIGVTDFASMWPYFFGQPEIPVGGADFDYQIELTNLGTPVVNDIRAFPFGQTGTLNDGNLRFYKVDGTLADTAVLARSVGVESAEIPRDMYPTLMVVDASGQLVKEMTTAYTMENLDILLDTHLDQTYLVIQDFYVAFGPSRPFTVKLTEITPADCISIECSNNAANQTDILLQWDLNAGDFLTAGFYLAADAVGALYMNFLDENLNSLANIQGANKYSPATLKYYADSQQTVYTWIQKSSNATFGTYKIEDKVFATPELESGAGYHNLEVESFPEGTFQDSGLSHFVGTAGDLALFMDVETGGTGWTAKVEELLAANFAGFGPGLDALAPADYVLNPAIPSVMRVPADGHYLHRIKDKVATTDLSAALYDLRFETFTPMVIAPPTAGSPTTLTTQSLSTFSDYAVFSLACEAWREYEITVTPDGGATLQPEVLIFQAGYLSKLSNTFYWVGVDTAVLLGLVQTAQAAGLGDEISAKHISATQNTIAYVLVHDIPETGTGTFGLNVTASADVAYDACADAQVLNLSGGPVVINSTLIGAKDDISNTKQNSCTYLASEGADLFYAVDLADGDVLDVEMDTDDTFIASLYLLKGCVSTPPCLAFVNSATGTPASFSFTVPVGGAGRYVIAADAAVPTKGNDFTLTVSKNI